MLKSRWSVLTLVVVGTVVATGCAKKKEVIHHGPGDATGEVKPGGNGGDKPNGGGGGAANTTPMIDEASLDKATKPCDDFYQYACGGWIKSYNLPPEKPIFTKSFNQLRDLSDSIIKGVLEGYAAGQTTPVIQAGEAKRLGDFYAACNDEASAETATTALLPPQLAKIDALADLTALPEMAAQLHLQGADVFFTVGSEQDSIDAQKMIGVADVGGMGLPNKDYYVATDQTHVDLRAQYVKHISKMLQLSGTAQADADTQAAAILKFETTLAEKALSPADRRDPKNVYHPIGRTGLNGIAPKFNWATYFTTVGAPNADDLNVYEPEFFKNLDATVAAADITMIKAYLRWHYVHAAAATLGKAFVDEDFAFFGKALTGQQSPLPRWKNCVAAANGAMGEALGEAYVALTFGEDARKAMKQLVGDVQGSFDTNLTSVDWLDDATRAMARKKLQAIANKIGYPDKLTDFSALPVDRSAYFTNRALSARFNLLKSLSYVGQKVDRARWDMTPQTVNAYYNPSMNEIVFPAAILQSPFFSAKAPASENYGAIGMVIGHELTHGFDDQGSQYDEVGNLHDWWSADIRAKFNTRTQCIVDQYNRYTVADGTVHLNGKLTLGENIADLGGMKLAVAAFDKFKTEHPGQPEQPVFGLNDEQQLFVSFAQVWCTKATKEMEALRAATDPHSAPKYRVNGVIVNTPSFAKAFGCAAGSPMSPANRCTLW
jgi:endothelin-converting enzyme/putative endopeptidase